MPPSLNLWHSFLRWRSGRGFGIHSPFAYRFVTEVLRQPYAFYSYSDIGADRTGRLVVRLMAAFKPATVALLGVDARVARAVSLADSRCEIADGADAADFVVADCHAVTVGDIQAILRADKRPHVLLLNCMTPPLPDDFGMVFDNCRGTVVIAGYRYLPPQRFAVRF